LVNLPGFELPSFFSTSSLDFLADVKTTEACSGGYEARESDK